jgi:hypothetical protein
VPPHPPAGRKELVEARHDRLDRHGDDDSIEDRDVFERGHEEGAGAV